MKKIQLLKRALEALGHDAFFIGFECGLVHCQNHRDISDDTASIITSKEYLELV